MTPKLAITLSVLMMTVGLSVGPASADDIRLAAASNQARILDLDALKKADAVPMSKIPDGIQMAACKDSGHSCNSNSDCCNNKCVEPPGICE